MRCRPAITTMSLGRACTHALPNKLDQAVAYGFEGVELFYEDLEYFAESIRGNQPMCDDMHVTAGEQIKQLCDERGLTIVCLQPFMHYEGLSCPIEHAKRIRKLKLWFRVAKVLRTDLILIPSNFLPEEKLSADINHHIADLIEAADLGAVQDPPMRFAYESLAWGTCVDTWEKCWSIVTAVNRPNFGICLDTFQIAGRVYADPASPCGTTGPNALQDLRLSLRDLVQSIDINKVFSVQLVSGERLQKPLLPGHQFYAADQPARMSWSRNCRLFYGEVERGDYLPTYEVAAALVDQHHGLGFNGWVCMELFSRTLFEKGQDVPAEHAKRGIESWHKLVEDFHLDQDKS